MPFRTSGPFVGAGAGGGGGGGGGVTSNYSFTGMAGGQIGVVANTEVILCQPAVNPGIGTHLVIAQALVFGATVAGNVGLRIKTLGGVFLLQEEFWIPDVHTYTLTLHGIITNAASRPFYFNLMPDAAITNLTVRQQSTGNLPNSGAVPGTALTVVQIA